MTAPLCCTLPDAKNWKFDKIKEVEKDRAEKLEKCDSAENLLKEIETAVGTAITNKENLLKEIETAVGTAITNNRLCIGKERAGKCPQDHRAVVQFQIGLDLFDWFFNGRTGYRAHFKCD